MSRILALVILAALQEPGAIWRGVYTAEQADRGREMYTGRCARCHGADLAGSRDYPLAGEGFMNH
jgi:mono/diheme cytochrome c family protein